MSIIYEALKKVENNKGLSAIKNTYVKSNIGIEEKTFKPHYYKNKFFLFLVIFSVISGLILSSSKLINLHKSKGSFFAGMAKTNSQFDSRAQLVNSVSKISGKYILEGVVDDGENPFAIINGRVLRSYDRIDDYMIMDISKDEVEMVNVHDKSRLNLSLSF